MNNAIAPAQSSPVGVQAPATVEAPAIAPAVVTLSLPANGKWKEHSVSVLNQQIQDAISFHKGELEAQSIKASGSGEVCSFKYRLKVSEYNKRQRRLLAIAQNAINLFRALNLPTE